MKASVTKIPSAYQAAKPSEYHRAPRHQGSGDASSGAAGAKLRDWARWLDENHDIVTGALDKLTNFIVGNGITIQPMVRNRRGELLKRVNRQIFNVLLNESNPRSWSRDVNVSGAYTRGEQEWIACRTWLRDGEILARLINRRPVRGALSYQVQLIEADHLPFELVRGADLNIEAIIHGVEKDGWGRPQAYHLYKQHPGDVYMRSGLIETDVVRVPAREIRHLIFSRRVGQTRGVPILHSTIFRLDDIAEYEDAHRVAARAAAEILGSIKRSPDMIADGAPYDASGDQREWSMRHGQIFSDLLPGEDLSWYKPEAPNPDATPFLDDQLRRASAGMGMGYSTISAKYDKSFSAARQEQSENWPNILKLRAQFISDFVRVVEYEPALEAAIAEGRVRIPREADPETVYAADYRGPTRPAIDDEKQAKADAVILETKTDSRHGRIRERGRDPVQVDAEIKADEMLEEKAPPVPLENRVEPAATNVDPMTAEEITAQKDAFTKPA